MNKKVKKTLKILGKTCLWLLAVILVIVILSPFWLGPLAKSIASSIVPEKTGTKFTMEDASLNIFTGKLDIKGVVLYNPEKYSPDKAVSFNRLSVNLKPLSLLSDVIHIEDISLDAPFVSYVTKDGQSNFDYISANLEKSSEPETDEKEIKQEEPVAASEKKETKVVIDRVKIKDPKVQLEIIPLPLPDIELKDIGKESDGASLMDAVDEVWKTMKDSTMNIGGKIGDFATSITNINTTAAKELSEKTTEALNDAANAATDAVKDGASSIKEGAESLFKKAGGLFGK